MFKKKKSLLLLSFLLIMTLIVTSCGKKTEGELVVAQGAFPKSLDPHASNDQPSSRVNVQIYDQLTTTDENMHIQPMLAESWEKIDDLTWEFKIREGVKFHNGDPLTPEDVKFSLDRMMESNQVAHIIAAVDKVEVGEDNTILITTKDPFAPLLAHLAHTAASILNEAYVTEKGEDYHNAPIGTGPYKFESMVSGDSVNLVRNDDYWDGISPAEKIVFRNIPEGTNRVIGLETGEVDIAYDVEPIDKATVKNSSDLTLIEGPSLSSQYIGFNFNKEPFNNPLVRKAINHAINVQDIIDVVLEGSGEIANGPINEGVFGFDPDLKGYSYDPELAKDLLAEAGFPDGFSTSLWTNDNPVRVKISEMVQEQLRLIGLDVKLETVEWGAYLERTAAGEHDMFILGWTTVTGDADYGLYPLFHSSQHGGAGNRTFYTNPKVDQLLEKGRTSADEDERYQAYKEAQELIVEDAPEIFLYFATQNAGINNSVEGFKLNPAGHHRLFGVEVK